MAKLTESDRAILSEQARDAKQQTGDESRTCPDCEGSGEDWMDASMFCPLCDGSGTVDSTTAESVNTDYKSWACGYRTVR